MAQFHALLTRAGRAKQNNAIVLSQPFAISAMALGDGGGSAIVPTDTMVDLTHEVYRAQLSGLYRDAVNTDWLVAELVVPMAIGPFWVREAALIDPDGDVVAVASLPDTYKPALEEGAGRDMVIRVIIQLAAAATVTLKLDGSVALASQAYVETRIGDHPHPDATVTTRGFLRLATEAEVLAGQGDKKAVTPPELAKLTATSERRGLVALATPEQFKTGDATTAVTPADVKSVMAAAFHDLFFMGQ